MCCPRGRICCHEKCCPRGEDCARDLDTGKDVCCPFKRVVQVKKPRFVVVCCPSETVTVGPRQCCRPGDPSCCLDTDGEPIVCPTGEICVNGDCESL
jgi:hypothetical protein